MKNQQKFIDQLRNSKYPEIAEKGYGYFIIWADGRGQVAYKCLQDAIDFIDQDSDDPYGMDVVSVKYREAEKGERVRNKFTEASARTYKLMKKAWDNPPRDDATYPGSNVSGPMPHEAPKSPGSKPRRDQRTIEDYHAPSQLDRDPIPGDAQPEQGTGGQSHSGEPSKPDNIYPEPSNWLRPLKGLPYIDENINHDFNIGFDTEYTQRQRGLNMRKVKKVALDMHVPKWTDPKFLGSNIYDNIKAALQRYQAQIRENPMLEGELLDAAIPLHIEKMQDAYVDAGVTLPIMLDAIKEVANLFIIENITFDTLPAEQKAVEIYPEGPRQQTSEISQMTAEESKLLNELSVDQIWNIARNFETENTPEGQAARGLIQKGIVANKLNMKKQSNNYADEVNRIIMQWQETAKVAGLAEVLNLFADRTEAYNTIMADLKEKYPKDAAHTIALQVIEMVPQLVQGKNKLTFKKDADNPKYKNGSLQTSDIPEKIITSIKDTQKNISKDKLYLKEDESDWVENGIQKLYHITILFGVNDDVAEDVKKIFKQYSPIKIETDGIDYFDNDDFSVAIMKCKSEMLTKFHDELKNKFENKDTYPKYKPHIAIAYLNKGERLEDVNIKNMSWEINTLELSTSDGKLEKVAALAVPIRESLDYPHSWDKKKKKKKDKEIVTEKEKKILQMDSNKLNSKKEASILDEPRASLDEAIWDIGRDNLPVLKPDVKIHIVENFLSYISKFGGYIKPEEFVKNMFYTGSTATYTYTDISDVDIHIIIDWNDLMALNPDKAKVDLKEMWQELHDVFWWTLNKLKLPGTKHPLTYYVMPPGDEKKLVEQKEEIYDIGHDVWLIPPGDVIALSQETMIIATEEAAEIMSRIEKHMANARKSIIDYDMLKILEKLNGTNTPVILQKFDGTLKKIDEELVALKDEYALLKQKRQEGFDLGKPVAPSESKNYTLGNIIFKLVERYKLMNILREIKRITDAKPTEHDQIDDVADALGFDDE